MSHLTRQIIGIENRTAQEVFDIMCDRFRTAEAALAEARKVIEPFAKEGWTDENGWTDIACQRDRVCDWFGPSDFLAAYRWLQANKGDE